MNPLKGLIAGSIMASMAMTASAATFVGDRTDFRDETIYFAMTTRFYDGFIAEVGAVAHESGSRRRHGHRGHD